MDFELDRGIAVDPRRTGRLRRRPRSGLGGRRWRQRRLRCSPCIGNAVRAELADSGQPGPDQPERLLPQPRPRPARAGSGCVGSAYGRPPLHRVAASLVQEQDGADGRADHRARDVRRRSTAPAAEVQRQIPPPELPPVEDCVEARFAPDGGDAGSRPCWSASAPASTRRTPAGPSASRAGPASSRAGSASPTTVRSTRSRCCWWSTRCRRPPSTSACPGGRPPSSSPPTCGPARAGLGHVRHATRNISGGQFEEDCEVWDSTGRLVAQSRQLALLPRPSSPKVA